MRLTRVYVDTPMSSHDTVELPPEPSHHLARVLRMREGQAVQLFNGRGGSYPAEIISIHKRSLVVRLGEYQPDPAGGSLQVCLAQGISRGSHMDYTLQKATELGVSRVIPLLSEHGNVRLDGPAREKKLGHWQRIMISACEQSGRNILPVLEAPVEFMDWIQAGHAGTRLLLDPGAGAPLAVRPAPSGELVIIAGPEGGFSGPEVELARQRGCEPVSLGPRVLRTETAAAAAIAVCQALWGDWR